MKKSVFALAAAAVMLTGCTSSPTGKNTADEPKNNTALSEKEEVKFAERDGMFLGYNEIGSLYTVAGSPLTYIVSGKGKVVLPLSDTSKDVIENGGKKYAVEGIVTNVRKVTDEEYNYDYYDYDMDYHIYDEDGKEVGSIMGKNFASYMGDGNFYAYGSSGNEYFIVNPFTGSEKSIGLSGIVYDDVNYRNVGILYLDEDYNVTGFSDVSGENRFDITGYSNGYGLSTKDATFLCLQSCADEETAADNGISYTESCDIYDLNGNKLNEKGYVMIFSRYNCLLAFDGNVTHVLDGKTAEELYTIDGKVWSVLKNGNYVVCNSSGSDGACNETYALMSKDGEVLSDGWDSYDLTYGSDFTNRLILNKEIDEQTYEKYVLDDNGNVLCGPVDGSNKWITATTENYYVIESYNEDTFDMEYHIYDYAGNEKYADKNYKRFSYYYNPKTDVTYYVLGYESPASNSSYIYEVLDSDMNIISGGFKDINYYGMSGNDYIISVAKGFDIGIYDFKTNEWIYKQSVFSELED